MAKTPLWQRKAGKNPKGGLNARGRRAYNRATGGNLKAPSKKAVSYTHLTLPTTPYV